MGLKTLLLAALLSTLELSSQDGGSMPGSPYIISKNDHSLQEVVLNATYSFNNRSNDAFLFRASAIRRAQRQVVKGIRYIVDFNISRTVCHKQGNSYNLSSCDFQPAGPLQQMFLCHLELWTIPWKHKSQTQVFLCKP